MRFRGPARFSGGWDSRTYLIGGFLFAGLWAIFAIPPFFESPHVLTICNKASCSSLSPEWFAYREVAFGLVFLGISGGMFVLAYLRRERV